MFVSVIIGSIPRMGKTFLLRLLALIAALDVRAELHLYDFKGTGDLSPLEPVAHRYRAGDDDEDLAYALADFRALREELRRRTKVIRGLPRDICPENKVTPELASNKTPAACTRSWSASMSARSCSSTPSTAPSSRTSAPTWSSAARRPGIVLILATQRPDAKSLPTGISANAVLRMCLKVMGQTENDMVLGTSAYKNGVRATMFAFSDKGICYFAGEGQDPAHRARLRPRRPGRREDRPARPGPARTRRNPVRARPRPGTRHRARVRSAGRPGRRGHRTQDVVRETVVIRLAALRPGAYQAWADLEPDARAAQLTAALKPYGIRTGQVWGTTADGKGANRRGITRDDLTKAITERNGKPGPGAPG